MKRNGYLVCIASSALAFGWVACSDNEDGSRGVISGTEAGGSVRGNGGNSKNTGGGAVDRGGGAGGIGGSAKAGVSASHGGAGGTSGAAGSGVCMVAAILSALSKSRVLVGASMDDATAGQAPFDLRYLYLAGGVFDGDQPCASCASDCTSKGASCANSAGCGWWGCWQWDQDPPGAYVRNFVAKAQGNGQIPMFTYYEILQASGAAEGKAEVAAVADSGFMKRILADWRFTLQQIGQSVAFLHIEPDFWGYAMQLNQDPHKTAAAVASANSTDCADQENTIAGLGKCMIAMSHKYAPNAKVGLHASGWGTGFDVLNNSDSSLDITGEANKLAAFLVACGAADGDFVALDACDRDAGYYESIGQNRWWDATNQRIPHFHQAFAWAKTLAEKVGKPVLWWQMPVGNMNLAGGTDHWKDNRLDYFFDHMEEVAAAHGFGVAYGAGADGQTTPETDGGHLVNRVSQYVTSGGHAPCP